MVKFSKELEAQLIPEWKEAFVNYRQLKKYIKIIKLKTLLNQSQPPKQTFGRSIFDSLRFLINNLYNSHNNNMQDIIQVNYVACVFSGLSCFPCLCFCLYKTFACVYDFMCLRLCFIFIMYFVFQKNETEK